MKVEGWLFLGCGVFLIGADVVYWYVSYDPTGTTALALLTTIFQSTEPSQDAVEDT